MPNKKQQLLLLPSLQPSSTSTTLKIYQFPVVSPAAKQVLLLQLQSSVTYSIRDVKVESCYYIDCLGKSNLQLLIWLTLNSLNPKPKNPTFLPPPEPLTTIELETVKWLLKPHYKMTLSINKSHFSTTSTSALNSIVVEIGPKECLRTAFSVNALSICSLIGGLGAKVTRFEAATRYALKLMQGLTARQEQRLIAFLSGGGGGATGYGMNQSMERYGNGTGTGRPALDQRHFSTAAFAGDQIGRRGRYEVSLLKLKQFSDAHGLQLTEAEVRAFEGMFRRTLHQPTPTSIELFSLAQASALRRDQTLVDILHRTSSSPKPGMSNPFLTKHVLLPSDVFLQSDPTKASVLRIAKKQPRCLFFNATVADHSVAVSPFHGATVAVGTRMREGFSTGRGATVLAGLAGYAFGDLSSAAGINGLYSNGKWASAREACLQGSAGVADYGNKFGEPLIGGFCRSVFGLTLGTGEDRVAVEHLKPMVFSGGVGVVEEELATKKRPDVGLCIVKVGGLPYRYGFCC